jgi:hypothetical protein
MVIFIVTLHTWISGRHLLFLQPEDSFVMLLKLTVTLMEHVLKVEKTMQEKPLCEG